MSSQKLTIADIAARAGVSKTTVSRVLNDKPDVLPETRERILKLVQEMHYFPSPAAIGLSRGKTGLVGILVPTLAWTWVLEVIRGVAERLERSPYELVLYTTSSQERNEELFGRTLAGGMTDGLLAILPPGALSSLSQVHRSGFPVVLIDDRGYHPDLPSVTATNRRGAVQALSHLLELGHQRIGYASGPMEYRYNQERLQGIQEALAAAGVPYRPEFFHEGEPAEAGGIAAVRAFFALPEPPTAIFAANDLVAFGVMEAAARRGLRIPQDLSVVGFDDLPQSALSRPALTTIRQPMYRMGQTAVEMLLTLIAGGRLPQARIELDTELVVRDSTTGCKL
jgi:LacI family transcriptional regulator